MSLFDSFMNSPSFDDEDILTFSPQIQDLRTQNQSPPSTNPYDEYDFMGQNNNLDYDLLSNHNEDIQFLSLDSSQENTLNIYDLSTMPPNETQTLSNNLTNVPHDQNTEIFSSENNSRVMDNSLHPISTESPQSISQSDSFRFMNSEDKVDQTKSILLNNKEDPNISSYENMNNEPEFTFYGNGIKASDNDQEMYQHLPTFPKQMNSINNPKIFLTENRSSEPLEATYYGKALILSVENGFCDSINNINVKRIDFKTNSKEVIQLEVTDQRKTSKGILFKLKKKTSNYTRYSDSLFQLEIPIQDVNGGSITILSEPFKIFDHKKTRDDFLKRKHSNRYSPYSCSLSKNELLKH